MKYASLALLLGAVPYTLATNQHSTFQKREATPQDMSTMLQRGVDAIVAQYLTPASASSVSSWVESFNWENNTWNDIDYSTGCNSRRANWPAQQHFIRIVTIASQYKTNNQNQPSLYPVISNAMNFWFDNNYTPADCMDMGGDSTRGCPCNTPGFWNPNWFDQMILMPGFISDTCLLMKNNLTETQLSNCTLTSQRVYDRLNTNLNGIGLMTGSNMLQASSIVVNLGLLTDNATTVQNAFIEFFTQALITNQTGADGVKADGSYLQHTGQLYTGNYGKDFINTIVGAFLQTAGTANETPDVVQDAFLTMMSGTEWMIAANHTGTSPTSLLWEYSTIGRMISFRTADNQASAGVALNFTQIQQSTTYFQNSDALQPIYDRINGLSKNTTGQGSLVGTRSFYASDYAVHRSADYVTTFKGFSDRTTNTECTNNQNPFGFHLSDGSIFSYIDGNEYTDVFAEWDWNLVPGTTVDYGETPLSCNYTQYTGNKSYVGSLNALNVDGSASQKGGIAVMKYLNPMTGKLSWEKTVYFFPGYYAVHIANIVSNSDAPVLTTLDQSNLKGTIFADSTQLNQEYLTKNLTYNEGSNTAFNLQHNNILYTVLALQNETYVAKVTQGAASNSGNWSTLGISTGFSDQKIFTATIEHPKYISDGLPTHLPLIYIAQLNVAPGTVTLNDTTTLVKFINQAKPSKHEMGVVRGAYNVQDQSIALAFWTAGYYAFEDLGVTVSVNKPVLVFLTKVTASEDAIYDTVTVSDPTQLLNRVVLEVNQTRSLLYAKKVTIDLPVGSLAGSSVSRDLSQLGN